MDIVFQVITLIYPCGDHTTYVDQVDTEDAIESRFMLDQHLSDGYNGTLSIWPTESE